MEVRQWPEDHYEIHDCPSPDCGAHDKMHPIEWDSTDSDDRWHLTVRCAECETFFEGIFDEHQIDSFDAMLDDATRDIQARLAVESDENMEEYVEWFTGALRAGEIYPADF